MIFGEDAPHYLCITGPNYKCVPIQDLVKHEGKTKPKRCVAISPKGERIPCRSLNQASVVIGKDPGFASQIGTALEKRGCYNTRTGWRIEKIKEDK